MPNIATVQRSSLPPNLQATGRNLANGRQYAGSNLNRQDRFDARRDRRNGNWGFLEYPLWLLWFDDACLAALDDDLECPRAPLLEAPLIDLWP